MAAHTHRDRNSLGNIFCGGFDKRWQQINRPPWDFDTPVLFASFHHRQVIAVREVYRTLNHQFHRFSWILLLLLLLLFVCFLFLFSFKKRKKEVNQYVRDFDVHMPGVIFGLSLIIAIGMIAMIGAFYPSHFNYRFVSASPKICFTERKCSRWFWTDSRRVQFFCLFWFYWNCAVVFKIKWLTSTIFSCTERFKQQKRG